MISIFFISKGIRSLDILSIGYYYRSYFFFVIKSHRLFYMKEQLINNNTYIYMAYITYTVRKIKIIKTMIIKKKQATKRVKTVTTKETNITITYYSWNSQKKLFIWPAKIIGFVFFCLFFEKFHNPKSLISHNSFLFFSFSETLIKN